MAFDASVVCPLACIKATFVPKECSGVRARKCLI
jgi:hypothetical protein